MAVWCRICFNDSPTICCDYCYQKLGKALDAIASTIAALDRLAMLEADSIASPNLDGWAPSARASERTMLHKATLVANELDAAAEAWCRYIMVSMTKPPRWKGNPGSYLAGLTDHISRQPYAGALLAEMTHHLRRADTLLGQDAEPRHLPVPCPSCDTPDVYLYPASFAGQPIAIASDCGWRANIDGQTWIFNTAVLKQQQLEASAKRLGDPSRD